MWVCLGRGTKDERKGKMDNEEETNEVIQIKKGEEKEKDFGFL